jgi:hypothetical protein
MTVVAPISIVAILVGRSQPVPRRRDHSRQPFAGQARAPTDFNAHRVAADYVKKHTRLAATF